jgi:hypothetical protein
MIPSPRKVYNSPHPMTLGMRGSFRVAGLSASPNQSPSRGAIQSGYLVHGKVASIVVCGLATATIDGLTFPFNFLSAVCVLAADRDSRTVV